MAEAHVATKSNGAASASDLPHPRMENGRFVIPWDGFKKPGFRGLIKYFGEKDNSNIPSNIEVLDKEFPVHQPRQEHLNSKPSTGLRVTWFGHATVLVQMDGLSILSDPVFSDRCGPVQFIGVPCRYRRAPCGIDELPTINAVIISHNHYDHLDYNSVKSLQDRFGSKLHWFVPTGLKSWMIESGCDESQVTELGWWEENHLEVTNDAGDKFRFIGVPAQHWSKRGLFDDNKTLWCGWCVIGPQHRFYFSGDTGYNDNIFKLIGREFGPIDLAALPIGAYEPRWFMKCQHVNPEEAFEIHKDTKAFNSIGIHWGTFKLSAEPYMEPREIITRLQQEADVQTPRCETRLGFFTVNPGESRDLRGHPRERELS